MSLPPYVLHALPNSFFLIWSPKWYLVSSTDHKAPRYVVFSTPLQHFPLEKNIIDIISVHNTNYGMQDRLSSLQHLIVYNSQSAYSTPTLSRRSQLNTRSHPHIYLSIRSVLTTKCWASFLLGLLRISPIDLDWDGRSCIDQCNHRPVLKTSPYKDQVSLPQVLKEWPGVKQYWCDTIARRDQHKKPTSCSGGSRSFSVVAQEPEDTHSETTRNKKKSRYI